jgi:hypothetical protein
MSYTVARRLHMDDTTYSKRIVVRLTAKEHNLLVKLQTELEERAGFRVSMSQAIRYALRRGLGLVKANEGVPK